MATIFSRIIDREIPAHIVAEDEQHIAFLDIRPIAKGHTLVVPKKEIPYIFDMEEEAMAALMRFAKQTAQAIEKVIDCVRIGMLVLGLEVPHVHIHLVPLAHVGEVDLGLPKVVIPQKEMVVLCDKIHSAFGD